MVQFFAKDYSKHEGKFKTLETREITNIKCLKLEYEIS